ncbi:Required for respiratory growth protein 9 mitochondrial [Acarospora aff. strigata]|nr:Required for respiratory growth protein 9 mitochondrial [Acarospora aff. strigata]
MSWLACRSTVIGSFLRNVFSLELKTSTSPSIPTIVHRRRGGSCIKQGSAFHQISHNTEPALEPIQIGVLDDLYVPFDEDTVGSKPTTVKAARRVPNDPTLPWSSANPPDPPIKPVKLAAHRSSSAVKENLKPSEPDTELRQGLYGAHGEAVVSTAAQLFLGPDDTASRSLRSGPPATQAVGNTRKQRNAAVGLKTQYGDRLRDLPLSGQTANSDIATARDSTARDRARRNGSEPRHGRSSTKSQTSTGSSSTRTTGYHSVGLCKRESWQVQKHALQKKFGEQGWSPRKRLSPDALEGIRALHAQYPDKFTTPLLADQFKVSPEAIRRILRSKWRPNEAEESSRRQRWDKRGEIIWGQMVELGVKPPKRWREMGITKKDRAQRSEKGTPGRHATALRGGDQSPEITDGEAEPNTDSAAVPWVELEGSLLEERIL